MADVTKLVTKLGPKEKDKEGYLEVIVREGTPEVKVTEIVQALATISSFFGARFDKGGSGGGGKSTVQAVKSRTVVRRFGVSKNTPQKPTTPRRPFKPQILPNIPEIGPGSWMGEVK